MDAEHASNAVLKVAGEGVGRCKVCQAVDKAPRLPIASTPMVSAFNAQVREDILFSGDIAALRAMELYPTYYI